MKNRIAAILLVMVLALALGVSAMADDYTSANASDLKEFNVTFGSDYKMQTFSSDDLDRAVDDMQPGDSVTLQFNLVNASDKTVSWYVKNTIIDTLEENASGGVYSYVLSYTAADGVTTSTIYSSDTVNQDTEDGEENSEGLKSAASELEDWVYLDKIAAGSTCHVSLKITLDGETQANDYQDSTAKIDLQFAAEVEATTTQTNTQTNTNVVKTGDEFNMPVMVVVAGVSGVLVLALAIWGVVARKKEKEDAAK